MLKRVTMAVRGGREVAKAVTSHYHKECYNTLVQHISGNFLLEIWTDPKSDHSCTSTRPASSTAGPT